LALRVDETCFDTGVAGKVKSAAEEESDGPGYGVIADADDVSPDKISVRAKVRDSDRPR
jgi:hypothetical protein